jgi:hypothetical protein
MHGRPALALGAVALLFALAVAIGWHTGGTPTIAEKTTLVTAATPPTGVAPAAPAPSRSSHARRRRRIPADSFVHYDDDAAARAWATVDMDEVRKAMPDNLYWKMSVPTKDPDVLRAREEERERWNVEYGKVLSNTATAEEIDAYYEHRRRLSNDYIAFAGFLLLRYGRTLPPRDVAFLKLAIKLHMARLEEIPRQIAEAQARREAHDAVRRAWLEDQKTLGAAPPGPAD